MLLKTAGFLTVIENEAPYPGMDSVCFPYFPIYSLFMTSSLISGFSVGTITCRADLEVNLKMMSSLEAWTRHAVSTHRGVAAQQGKLQQAALLLIRAFHSNLSGSTQLRRSSCSSKGEPPAESAEIRAQLSVATSIFKMRDTLTQSRQTGANYFLWFLSIFSHHSEHGGLPAHGQTALQHLNFSQLYTLSTQNQPLLDWGPVSTSDLAQIRPGSSTAARPHGEHQSLRSFTSSTEHCSAYLQPSILSHSIHLLHRQATEWLVKDTILDADLGSNAVAVLTSGPAWSLFHAASRISLHPYGRLASGGGFGENGIFHPPTHNAAQFFADTSELLHSQLLRCGGALACISAANTLLHSEVLDCLVGQLWHVGVPVGRHTRISSNSRGALAGGPQQGGSNSSGASEPKVQQIDGGIPAASPQPRSTIGIVFSGLRRALAFSYGFFWNTLYAWAGWNSAGSREEEEQEQEEACDDWVAVGQLLLGAFTNLRNAMRHACSHNEGLLEEGSPELDAFCSRLGGLPLTSLALGCASPPLFFFDILNQAEAEAMEVGMSTLSHMRSLVTELLAVLTAASAQRQPKGVEVPAGTAVAVSEGTSWSRWEVLQAALLRSLPPEQQEDWGRPLGCCNPGCTNLSGPSELQLKTKACGGGCGSRYCDKKCSAQGWRLGHRYSCKEISAGRG